MEEELRELEEVVEVVKEVIVDLIQVLRLVQKELLIWRPNGVLRKVQNGWKCC